MSGKETEAASDGSHLSEEERQDLENLMFDIKRSLQDIKYGFVLDHAVLPNENIEIILKLGSHTVEGNYVSQRLSYNDLMGDIMLTLNEMGYAVAVHGKVASDKNVVISLVLPHTQFDKKSKKAVQQLATDVIKKYKFDPEIFRFNITSYYNS